MKIKTQERISLIVFVILTIVIFFSVFASNNQLHEIQQKQQIIDSVEKSSFELYYLENDYLVHGGTIPVERWNAKYAVLTEQLSELTLTDPSEQVILNDMFARTEELNTHFSNLVAVMGDKQGKEPIGASQELKEFYASTLAVQTQTLMSRSTELSKRVKAEALAVEQRTFLIISLSIVALMLFVLLNYLVINRSVLKSISALLAGTERIGSGDLETKIETLSNDELGFLSLAFNEMSSSIRNAHTLLLNSNVELEEEITERKRAEETLRKSEERYRTIIETSQEGIWTLDRHFHINYINERMAGGLGYTQNEMLGRSFTEFIPEDELPHANVQVELRKEGVKDTYERRFLHRNGNIRIMLTSSSTIYGPDGTFSGSLTMFTDITERKRAEDALIRVNQKLNVISQLTRKDLTNQIFVLNSYLELAKKQLTGQDHIIETVQKGVLAIQSIHETIEYSKDYQDMGAIPPKWQNVKMALLFGLSHISIGNIQHSLETENLEIFADPLLEKVCQRLFENSVKHGDQVTRIRVSHTATPDGVTIIFEDDGIGIPQERKEQIFLRGESVHASMRSLIFVREILDITGITIRETGEPGKGARFEMTVPKGAYRFGAVQKEKE